MKKLSEIVKMVERYLNNYTYNFEIINCNVRKNKKDYEFNIIEYGPLGKIENENGRLLCPSRAIHREL